MDNFARRAAIGPGTPAVLRPAPIAGSELVGPESIPPGVVGALQALAAAAQVPLLRCFEVCAATVLRRVAPTAPVRACVSHGSSDVVVTGSDLPDEESLSGVVALHALRGGSEPVCEPPDGGRFVDLVLHVSHDGGHLFVERMAPSADLAEAQVWSHAFLQLLSGMAADPRATLAGLPLLGPAQRYRVLHRLNAYKTPRLRHRTLTEPFEEQARRTPEAVALVEEDGTSLGYGELDRRANRLAHHLISLGAGPGRRVAICVERSIAQIVAIHAVVKAGACYVPLDPDLPDARIAFVLDDSGPSQVLVDAACRDRVPAGPWRVIDVEDAAAWRSHPEAAPPPWVGPKDLLHILYTSGTTGRPKGVAYPVDGALAHLEWMQSRYPYEPGDTALAKTSMGFDVSIWEIFWPLYHGARLVICRPGGHRDPRHLADLVAEHGVGMLFLPPTVMMPFLAAVPPAGASRLRLALCGGEPVTPRVRDTFYKTLPHATIVNCYGPTEAGSVVDTTLRADPGARVPLGRPSANFRIALLDERCEPVPVGTPGEVYIGGRTGLALGYWNSPALTAERFVADPHGPPGSRMYRTGDLCRYDADGVLEHLGRIDRQLKLRGLRVEPGEVETAVAAHPAVADCAVLAEGTPPVLVAFVVPAPGTEPEALGGEAVLDLVAERLPEHMVPDRVVPVPAIPQTVNGKVDRDALLAAWHRVEERREITPPADEVEAALVGIYERLLDTAPIGITDTFSRLGGHSVLAFAVLDECERRFGAKPDLRDLLGGTIQDVARSLRPALGRERGTA